MKIYIDFDDTVLNTKDSIDKLYIDKSITRREFVSMTDWEKIIENSNIINNSIDYIKKSKYDISILSKISSINEGQNKVKYLRQQGLKNDIFFAFPNIDKSSIVSAEGNILIDDKIYNLDSWEENGGIAIYFNKDNLDIDFYGRENIKYPKLTNLSILLDDIEKMIK